MNSLQLFATMLVMVAAQSEGSMPSKCTSGSGTEACCTFAYGSCDGDYESKNVVPKAACTEAESGSDVGDWFKYECVPEGQGDFSNAMNILSSGDLEAASAAAASGLGALLIVIILVPIIVVICIIVCCCYCQKCCCFKPKDGGMQA